MLVWSIPSVIAVPFINPPEVPYPITNGTIPPAGGWITSFPNYDRNVLIDFSRNPNDWPDATPPEQGKDLIPNTNYHIQGAHSELYESDWIDWDGDVSYVDTIDGRTGLFGFNGLTDGDYTMTLHLDNLTLPNPVKHVYVEAEFYSTFEDFALLFFGIPSWVTPEPPTLFKHSIGTIIPLGDNWYRSIYWAKVEPNPTWEEINWGMGFFGYTDPQTSLFDFIHVATECVSDPIPEPTTMLLFGSGLIGLAGFRRNLKKS